MVEARRQPVQCAVVGRFPPPIDGQTLLTRRLLGLLESSPEVDVAGHINTEPPGARVAEHAPFTFARFFHFVRLRSVLSDRLRALAPEVILWPAISPGRLGHVRDILCTLTAFPDTSRIIAVIHRGNFDDLFSRSITRTTALRMVGRVDAFVFNSVKLSKRCATWIPAEKRFVVSNTVDDDVLFSDEQVETVRRSRETRSGIRALYLSNMIPSKGYGDVASALALVDDHCITATFAGAWEAEKDRVEFEDLISRMGLEDRIDVLGPVNERSEVRRLYMESDVFVLPTYYPNEAQPLALIEAMNTGLPVIVTAHGSIPEIVEKDRSGQFVSARSPADIAAALLRLKDPDFRAHLSRGARLKFNRTFSPDAVRQEWIDLITRIHGRGQ